MFTPVESSIGALMLHVATTSFLVMVGRTVGLSSVIFETAFKSSVAASTLVCGFMFSAVYTKYWLPDFVPNYPEFGSRITSLAIYAGAGFLVGLGSKLQSGCTSGHFLNGVSRLRVRSIAAVAVFCSVAIGIVSFFSLAPACYDSYGEQIPCYFYDQTFSVFNANRTKLLGLLGAGVISSYILLPLAGKDAPVHIRELAGINTGFFFGMGLFISGMASPAKPQGFLSVLNPIKFDPSLAMIVFFTIIPNIIAWRRLAPQTEEEAKTQKPLLEDKYNLPFSTAITPKFLLGSVIFGAGWGVLGICPGPGLLGAFLNGPDGWVWLALFLLGYYTAGR